MSSGQSTLRFRDLLTVEVVQHRLSFRPFARISRIDELQPSKCVHLITRWCREAPAPERAQNDVEQRVIRPSDARPPMSFGRAGRQFSADIKHALPSIGAIDR